MATAAAAALTACTAGGLADPAADVSRLRTQVVAEQPHDRTAFTEGLELAGDVLYEGTGLAGHSQLRELDPATGAVRRTADLPDGMFGEGVTVVGPRIWQLTYQDGFALEWDRAGLTVQRRVPITGEGWGLCFDGTRLVRTDGTARLRFHDPATFAETGSVPVTLDQEPLPEINELECVGGRVWANVWKTDRIVAIDPTTGQVTAVVDASGLLPKQQGMDVLNGIAQLAPGEFLLTGKFWPTSFRVRFVPQ
jgi:glutaminyl-peptide cyclotransferase